MRKNPYNDRMQVIMGIFIVIGIIYIIRLFLMQIIDSSYTLSANNNVLRYNIEYPARGLIYDRNDKLLVYNEATYDLMVVPRLVRKLDTLDLCKLLDIDKQTFINKLNEARSYSRYKPSIFEKQLSKETYGYLQEKLFELPGFYVQTRTLRKYPKPMAAHTLGYIGEVSPETIDKKPYYKSGDYIGISGIESSYEESLRGKRGLKIEMVDVFNRPKGRYMYGKYDTISVSGKDLHTTIDAELEDYGEMLMKNKSGSIVAIDPKTGEILTIVSSPAYDPNLLVGHERTKNYNMLEHDESKPLFNRALMAKYPPGSTFKLVNALIGQQEGVLFPDTKYSCERGFHFGGLTVGCHVHPSPLDLLGSIEISCNAYYCKTFRSIIENRAIGSVREAYVTWYNYVKSFGFGKRFNSDLPNELSGFIPDAKYYDRYHGLNRWNSISIISLAIGQGELGITPLQLANLSATISNRGFYYTPHIIKGIGNDYTVSQKYKTKNYTAIERKYFDIVVQGMYEVVEAGTGRGSKIDSLSVCGKTGTAQNPHGKDHSIFIAFAPKDNPKIAICVVVENAGFGATYAAPIASLMIEKYLFRRVKRKEIEQRMLDADLIRNVNLVETGGKKQAVVNDN